MYYGGETDGHMCGVVIFIEYILLLRKNVYFLSNSLTTMKIKGIVERKREEIFPRVCSRICHVEAV